MMEFMLRVAHSPRCDLVCLTMREISQRSEQMDPNSGVCQSFQPLTIKANLGNRRLTPRMTYSTVSSLRHVEGPKTGDNTVYCSRSQYIS